METKTKEIKEKNIYSKDIKNTKFNNNTVNDNKNYIFNKIKIFAEKYNIINNSNFNIDILRDLYVKNIVEIYQIIIYLWVDIIHDEEDSELIEIYNNIENTIHYLIKR